MSKENGFVDSLIAILVRLHAIPEKEQSSLKESFAKDPQPNFDDFLLEEGLVSKQDLLQALSDYYQVPWFDVDGYLFSTHYLHMFPKDFLLRNVIIPLRRDENMMIIIASEPDKEGLEDKIGEHVSYDIQFNVGLRQDITDAVKEFYDKAYTEGFDNIDDQEKREQVEIDYDLAKKRGYIEDK